MFSGDFLIYFDASDSLWSATYTSTALLRAADRFSLSIMPNYTPPTASELTYQLLQRTFPTVTDDEFEFQIYSYKLQDRYVTYKNMTTYRHFLTIHGGHSVATTYPIVNWKFIWDSTNKLFTIRTNDGAEDVYMGRLMQQADDTYTANPGAYYYADNSLVYSDNFKVEHVTSSTGEHLFKISQGTKSLKVLNTYAETGTPEDVFGYTDGMGIGTTPTDVLANEAFYYILKDSSGSGITRAP